MTDHDEYLTQNGQTISIQHNGRVWEVACWNEDDSNHWYFEFADETAARTEYERWR